MFPITLQPAWCAIALVGRGVMACERLKKLDEAKMEQITVFSEQPSEALRLLAGQRLRPYWPNEEDICAHQVLMVVDIEAHRASSLALLARKNKRLVNVEDKVPYCDFFHAGSVRQGDLLFAVSTGGKSPRLSRRLRMWLAALFSPAWGGRLELLAEKRQVWINEGYSPEQINQETDAIIDGQGWFETLAIPARREV